ncbi:hypothetical protein [Streptomyces antarcticus]|uniref:hypothetical protein n=1 Tax=Streptomyces antarcticus TaxID=2996458 RepID=UPI002272166A|nr:MULTISPECIES: hypothetical protein [unclassified Streptomyces]MCY0947667.1 hypothetical protein [Streptomyces sp. H34-AA3]
MREPRIVDGLPRADAVYMEPVVQPDYAVGRQLANADKPSTPAAYTVNRAMLEAGACPELLVLHSLPRLDELALDVDATPFNGYWREASNAVHVRMALLEEILGG